MNSALKLATDAYTASTFPVETELTNLLKVSPPDEMEKLLETLSLALSDFCGLQPLVLSGSIAYQDFTINGNGVYMDALLIDSGDCAP